VAVNTNPDSAVTRRLSSLSILILFWQFRETGCALDILRRILTPMLCVSAHSASDFDTDTDSTSLMTHCPAAGRQETLPFKTIASAHQANEVAQQMH
jgi:hypothetical protein